MGDGINGGKRVLDAIGRDADDLVFISDEVRSEILRLPSDVHQTFAAAMRNRGRHRDKHDRPWRIYELEPAKLA